MTDNQILFEQDLVYLVDRINDHSEQDISKTQIRAVGIFLERHGLRYVDAAIDNAIFVGTSEDMWTSFYGLFRVRPPTQDNLCRRKIEGPTK